jgi:hypothetical protein
MHETVPYCVPRNPVRLLTNTYLIHEVEELAGWIVRILLPRKPQKLKNLLTIKYN